MKSMNLAELAAAAEELSENLMGAQLQEVFLGPHGPVLQFWRQGPLTLYFDLTPVRPVVIYFDGRAPLKKNRATKPSILFLRSHGVNKLFDAAWVEPEKGRVLFLSLRGEDSHCLIEARLFPHGQNLLVQAGTKFVSWSKPKELPASDNQVSDFEVARSLSDISKESGGLQKKVRGEQSTDVQADALKRTRKALKKLELELEKKQSQLWQKAGEVLLQRQDLDVGGELSDYVDPNQSLAWNIENCFSKAKDNKRKTQNLEGRLLDLTEELKKIESGEGVSQSKKNNDEPSLASQLMQKSGVKGRKMSLSGGAEAIIGRSAKDNLSLLRRAKAWDLWLHLRDFPGAHAIIRREKNKALTQSDLHEVSRWLIRESFGQKKLLLPGDAYQVVVAECRYVRPIKGDKLGRVTYQNEEHYRFSY